MNSDEPLPELKDLSNAPVVLVSNKGAVTADQYQHLTDAFTRVTEDNTRLKEELASLKLAHDTETILNKLIVPYAFRAFVFMCVYCVCVFSILLISIFCKALPSPVLQTLVGSTAAAVIGLVGMVLTGTFVGARRR